MSADSDTFPRLETLGPRICIFGPSNAGKSTLAVAMARALAVPAVYLDLLYHLPNTDWTPRPAPEFERLHAEAIADSGWVMEGNYSRLMADRLNRATGIVLIDTPAFGNLYRYVRRTLFERDRIGTLEGGRDSLKWLMIRHIAYVQPRRRNDLHAKVTESGLPFIKVRGLPELNILYRKWRLSRPR